MQKRIFYVVVLLLVLLYGAYHKALENQFCSDDYYLIVKNGFVKTWDNFPRLFQRNYISTLGTLPHVGEKDIGSGEVSARQVCTLSLMADYWIWKLNPFGFHLTNLVIHFLNALIVLFLALRVRIGVLGAMLASLIFILHPVNGEVVAVITSRDDSVMFFFYGLSLLTYLLFRDSKFKKREFYVLSIVFSFFAAFSKESAVTLPFIIILYDFCFPPEGGRRLRYYVPYFLVTFFYLVVWFFVMPQDRTGVVDYFGGDFLSAAATLIAILAMYFHWLVLPLDIPFTMVDHSIVVKNIFNVSFFLSLISVLSVLVLMVVFYRRKWLNLFFAIAWFFIALLPVMPLPFLFNVLYATRFLYVPMIGFCLIVGIIFEYFYCKMKTPVFLIVVVAAVLGLYSLMALERLPWWRDDVTYNFKRLQYYPDHSLAFMNVGLSLEGAGVWDEAEKYYLQAIEINSGCSDCYNQLGLFYLKLQNPDKSIFCFERAVSLDPSFEDAENNLCSALGQMKRFAESETCFHKFLSRYPRSFDGYRNLATTYMNQGKILEAEKTLEKAKQMSFSSAINE